MTVRSWLDYLIDLEEVMWEDVPEVPLPTAYDKPGERPA